MCLNLIKVSLMMPCQYRGVVRRIKEDSIMVMVILYDGYKSGYQTKWVIAKERYERGEYTLKQIKNDLCTWLESVKVIEDK